MNNLWPEESMNPRVREELVKHHAMNQMDINKAIAKEQYLNDLKMDLAQRKMQLQEYRREAKKAEYVEVVIDAEGGLKAWTKNAMVNFPERQVANFQVLKATCLQSSNGESGIIQLDLKIGIRKTSLYLNIKKMGKMDYILGKITAVGGQIYGSTKKEKEKILTGLWVKLCDLCEETYTIPVEYGWYKDKRGDYKFAEEGMQLWADIAEKAK